MGGGLLLCGGLVPPEPTVCPDVTIVFLVRMAREAYTINAGPPIPRYPFTEGEINLSLASEGSSERADSELVRKEGGEIEIERIDDPLLSVPMESSSQHAGKEE